VYPGEKKFLQKRFFGQDWLLCIYSKMILGLSRHFYISSNYIVKISQNVINKTLITLLKHHWYNSKLTTPFWRKKNLFI